MKIHPIWLILIWSISSCGLLLPAADSTSSPPLSTTPIPTVTNTARPLSLDATPLIWFAPLPPLAMVEGREFTGSDDFIDLFQPDALWQTAAGHIQVFKLYGEWVAYKATNAELQQVVEETRRRGIALAVEAGPLNATESCGQGIEGFPGTGEGLKIAQRIKSAGGTLTFIALDEPYFFAHYYNGPQACHWDADKIAKDVGEYIQAIKGVFPDIRVGDTEALSGASTVQGYTDWLDVFREVNGYDLAFLHLDIDWSRITWPGEFIAIEEYGDKLNIPVGIIYIGNGFDKTDEAWLSAAGERVKKLEIEQHANPDHILFQSWNDKPDHVLPESTEFTFTDFINDYFTDKTQLGFKREGRGANLALGKPVRISSQMAGMDGALAVDGDLGTLWNSGGGPTQWIEIDLGAEFTLQEISLTVSQYPEGRTVHRILGRGTSGEFVELTTFDGNASDGQVLIFTPPQPVQGIQFIRVETISTPSWVSWREIEVIDAGN